ncbi:M48 family metalloprotease [Actinokineospora sp. PR83]|uniref:M48 family metalloprotease n=1 Tax=Actinokineospora sp. PR83 TaxID=2884908 RepID=UPI001F1EB83A|nr:M48 family metalloprotease [Actinokineospora sp. PR83]MCG8915287.1 M48 family metalloprotease [Actinokineospora sp. PR83]
MVTLRRAGVPRRLWWVHLLVLLMLASAGAGAAQAFFEVNNFGGNAVALACLAGTGVVPGDDPVGWQSIPLHLKDTLAACTADYTAQHGTAALVGALVLPAVALLLMLVGGFADRRRLHRREVAVAALAERFGVLCDSQGLLGRSRPRLVLVPPASGVRTAYTTGLPFRSPWVVVPSAYEHAPVTAFDVVVLHEFGHIRSRDLLWASAVWWTGWLLVPAFVLSVASSLKFSLVLRYYNGSVITAVVAAVAALLLRAALLRRRELVADEYAAEALGDREAVRTAVSPAGEPVSRLRQVFAVHPTPEERQEVGKARLWESGFLFSAAAGLAAMFAYQFALQLSQDTFGSLFDEQRWPLTISAGLGALVWAVIVVPAWTRRAAGEAGWVSPWVGSMCGLVLGFLAHPPGADSRIASTVGPRWPVLLLFLVVVSFAATAFAIGCAQASGARASRLARVGAVVAVAAVLGGAITAVTYSMIGYTMFDDLAAVRFHLATVGFDLWGHTLWVVLAGVLLVVWGNRPAGWSVVRQCSGIALLTGTVGGVAAGLSLVLRHSDDVDRRMFLVIQMGWVSALVGVVALLTALVVGRSVPTAVATSVSAVLWAGSVQYAVTFADDIGRNWTMVWMAVRNPTWSLFVALLVCAPVALVVIAVTRRSARGPRAFAWGPLACLATAGLALLLVGGFLTPVTVREGDTRFSLAASPHQVPEPLPAVPGTADPGRPLDSTTATAALSGLPALMPRPFEAEEPLPPATGVTFQPKSCDDVIREVAAAEAASAPAVELERAYSVTAEGTVSGMDVAVSLESHTDPQDLSGIDREVAACPEFRLPAEDFDTPFWDGTMRILSNTGQPHPSRVVSVTQTAVKSGRTAVFVFRQNAIAVGHNVLRIAISYGYVETPPAAAVRTTETLMTSITTDVLRRLGR